MLCRSDYLGHIGHAMWSSVMLYSATYIIHCGISHALQRFRYLALCHALKCYIRVGYALRHKLCFTAL